MTISPETEAKVLRYYHAEHWRIGTIATQLGVHHGTVPRVLAQSGLPRLGAPRRASRLDPYLPFVRETLEQFPTLTASRLYVMVKERGYAGRPDHFRHLVALHRPRPEEKKGVRILKHQTSIDADATLMIPWRFIPGTRRATCEPRSTSMSNCSLPPGAWRSKSEFPWRA